MREWPQAQLLLADAPEFGQAMRLHNQEPDDQGAKDDQFSV
jgi:hypothetical protein